MQSVELSNIKPMSTTMRESVRALRTNLQFCGDDVRTILFTSSVPNEGKSMVVLDLARSIGESGKHVLLVDTDIRKSVMIREYSVKTAAHQQIFGLSHYLSGQKKMDEVLYHTDLSNVDIVFAGRSVPNPTEILGKKYFTDLLEYGRENYDYVLLDCAPVTAAIDAVLEAHYCDGAVLVISQGAVSSRVVMDTKQQLENSGVRILGAVLNKVPMDGGRYGHYYGRYYGSYYGSYYGKYNRFEQQEEEMEIRPGSYLSEAASLAKAERAAAAQEQAPEKHAAAMAAAAGAGAGVGAFAAGQMQGGRIGEQVTREVPRSEPEQQVFTGRPQLKENQKELFRGFTSIGTLPEQIAGAIWQAENRKDDRTSRTGNILILGAHGCGKTTIATGIAKAIAEDMGTHSVKMARIYAADLNRKAIAATIAKIAGGVLIVEEAGDLDDAIVDQLTTAMEFRTDGMIMILEDEQRYIHDLLMRHPRFTMKFTAQIYIPEYSGDDLVRFGQIYANSKDYVLSEKAVLACRDRIEAAKKNGEAVSVTNVIGLVDRAIKNANTFFRRLASSKKRYDEEDRVILLEKDFR